MQIEFKLPKAHICQDNMCFKTTFVLVKNLTDKVILGNPFLCSLYLFTVDSKGITTQPFGQTIKFRFIGEPVPRNIVSVWIPRLVTSTFSGFFFFFFFFARVNSNLTWVHCSRTVWYCSCTI